jgi:hypothetical protein
MRRSAGEPDRDPARRLGGTAAGRIGVGPGLRDPAFRGTLDSCGDPDGDVTEAAWRPPDVAAALLAAHPFPFVRSVARHALLRDERNATAQCYFRRDDNGEDIALVFESG